jgi:transcriptional regulator with XRE-family HTH domain
MSADPNSIGARLRSERKARRLTVDALAEALRDNASERERRRMPKLRDLSRMIRGYEAGEHVPGPRNRMLYAAAFGIDEAELFEADEGPRVVITPSEQRGGLLPAGGLSGRLANVGRVRAGSIEDLSARVHALRLADDLLAGGDLIAPAFRELDGVVRMYRDTTHDEEASHGLLTVIGEFAQIAGWVASDAGQHDRAAETYELGISAAREAGDGTLESNLTGSLAYQITNAGDPREAVPLAQAAIEATGTGGPPRARALAWDRLAWAHAKAQDAQAAMRALGEAGAALADHDGGREDPPYLYWVDGGELQIMEARAYTELRRPLRAVPILVDVLNRYDATHTRELTLYLSWLAVALADANEPEEAAAAAGRMLELGADVASERTAQRGRVVLARLEPYRDVTVVRELLESAR